MFLWSPWSSGVPTPACYYTIGLNPGFSNSSGISRKGRRPGAKKTVAESMPTTLELTQHIFRARDPFGVRRFSEKHLSQTPISRILESTPLIFSAKSMKVDKINESQQRSTKKYEKIKKCDESLQMTRSQPGFEQRFLQGQQVGSQGA